MGYSDYTRAGLLDYMFGQTTSFSPPDTFYVALSTTDPGSDGSTISEPVGGSYARVGVAKADWSRVSFEVDNDNVVQFAQATGSWGTITHFALFDSLSGGNFLGSNALDSSKVISSGNNPEFSAGDINWTLS